MKYVVAVSGGVDSVVLLDMMARRVKDEVIVAHVDHGIRGEESTADARFVTALANRYQVPIEIHNAYLDTTASEDDARSARYNFLYEVATAHDAVIVTAHHQDDLIETVIINLIRGTGWRGLTPFLRGGIIRPLKAYSKNQLHQYAVTHNLEWVEDSTNTSELYLRNRIRQRVKLNNENKQRLLELVHRQYQLREQIEHEVASVMQGRNRMRHFLTMIDESSAVECLRYWCEQQSVALTRPQLIRLLYAVKTQRDGSSISIDAQTSVVCASGELIVKRHK